MNLVEQHRKEISKLCEECRVRKLSVFGSTGTSSFNKESDVDFMVQFYPIDDSSYADNYYNLKYALQNILRRPVDLLEEQAVNNPYFKQSIEQQLQVIYGN